MSQKFKTCYNLTNDEVVRRVKIICDERGYDFISFCDKDGNECGYKNNQTYLKLYCPKCNKVWTSTTYNRFMQGGKCPNCKRVSEESARKNISRICNEHNYTFLYFCDKDHNESTWNGVVNTYLAIRCNNCGNVWYTCSYDNFVRGRGCPKCKSYFKENRFNRFKALCKKNNWEILEYQDEYQNNTEWESSKFALLKCNVCGHIWRKSLNTVYAKSKCPNCANKQNGKNHIKKEEECLPLILELCGKRDYKFLGYCDKNGNECDWYGSSTYLILECLRCNQVWKTCTFYNFTHHLRGCPKCNQSHLELEVKRLLIDNDIEFEEQKRFDWLGTKSLDFYIPSKNIAIECQGRQHFECSDFFGGEEENNKIRERDMEKKRLCEEHNVDLIYFSNLGITYPYEVLESEDILLKRVT